MKKVLSLILALALAFTFAACGEEPQSADSTDDTVAVSSEGTLSAAQSPSSSEVSSMNAVSSAGDAKWREFLKDYDKWVDDYISLLKKYKADPTDFTILTDYTEMMSDMVEWSNKADEVAEELEDPAEVAEYAAELAKIAAKLAEAAY